MARVKRGVTAHKRHKRLLDAAEGRMGAKSRLVKAAREASLHSMAYATRDRKQRKRQMRELWIVRINAAARLNGMTRDLKGLRDEAAAAIAAASDVVSLEAIELEILGKKGRLTAVLRGIGALPAGD